MKYKNIESTINNFHKFAKKFNNQLSNKIISQDKLNEMQSEIKYIKELSAEIDEILNLVQNYDLFQTDLVSEKLHDLYLEMHMLAGCFNTFEEISRSIWSNYINEFSKKTNKSEKLSNLLKIKEIELKDYSSYILENTYDKIIIKSNGGISIFNNDFDKIKDIFLFHPLCPDKRVFKKFSSDEILIYSSEENYAILVNLISFSQKFIRLPESITQYGLSSIYFWKYNFIIMSDRSHTHLFKICFESSSVNIMSMHELKLNYSLFYDYWVQAREFILYEVENSYTYRIKDIPFAHPSELNFIFRDYENKKIGFYDFISDSTICVDKFDPEYYELAYSNRVFALAKDRELSIIKDNEEIAKLETDEEWEIVGIRFLKEYEENKILVLCREFTERIDNKLTLYQVLDNR